MGYTDYDYRILGIFFEADYVVYEQNKKIVLKEADELNNVEHFLTVSGSKLLLG